MANPHHTLLREALAVTQNLQLRNATAEGYRVLQQRLAELQHLAHHGRSTSEHAGAMALCLVGGGVRALYNWQPVWPFDRGLQARGIAAWAAVDPEQKAGWLAQHASAAVGLTTVDALCSGKGAPELAKRGLTPGLANAFFHAFLEGGVGGLVRATDYCVRGAGLPVRPRQESAHASVPRTQATHVAGPNVRTKKRRATTPQPQAPRPAAKRQASSQLATLPPWTAAAHAGPTDSSPLSRRASSSSFNSDKSNSSTSSQDSFWSSTGASTVRSSASSAREAESWRPNPAVAPSLLERALRSQDPVPLYSIYNATSALVPRAYVLPLLAVSVPVARAEERLPAKLGNVVTEMRLGDLHAWFQARG